MDALATRTSAIAGSQWEESIDALAEWAGRAKPGEQYIYHRGEKLKATPVVQFARHLQKSGVILFVQIRRGVANFDYVAVRSRANGEPASPPLTAVEKYSRMTIAEHRQASEEAEQLFDVLRKLASSGQVCPTNAELARLSALSDAKKVTYRLLLLQKAGKIDVETKPGMRRVVTICATGRKTACGIFDR